MSASEVAWRARDKVLQQCWRIHSARPPRARLVAAGDLGLAAKLPAGTAASLPADAAAELVASARGFLAGDWHVLGVVRPDLVAPDWFLDPVTGRRAPSERFAFDIAHRSEAVVGNVKAVWEPSRLQHVTLLAAASFVSRKDSPEEAEGYAENAASQLSSWWSANPFLRGIHWTSGIEVAIRLIAFVWVRRLLDDWPGVRGVFEENPLALAQIYHHQRYLASFRSRGSSANNHAIAETAGQLIASSALPWFEESSAWRKNAAARLEVELEANTFPDGLNREQASEYHALVAELGLLAAVEAAASGSPLSDKCWDLLCAMADAAAAIVDERVRGPRQGDGDGGRAIVLDAPSVGPYTSLLACGAALFGPLPWWPATSSAVAAALLRGLLSPLPPPSAGDRGSAAPASRRSAGRRIRPRERPDHFGDAGLTILRSGDGDGPEIWCRCDGGPHGLPPLAAHAHSDALSVEVRHGGIDILADPGTYCYHGEPEWRRYFRSTLAHNSVQVAGSDQSVAGGPFLWSTVASTKIIEVRRDGAGHPIGWSAEHDGYRLLDPPVGHRRAVDLIADERRIEITDRLTTSGRPEVALSFNLGPTVGVELDAFEAHLSWQSPAGAMSATIVLPPCLSVTCHRGETAPPLGWYSPQFGEKLPTSVLLCRTRLEPGSTELRSSVSFAG